MARFVILVLLLFLSLTTIAAPIYILEDEGRNLNAEQVYALFRKGKITQIHEGRFNAGLTHSVFWLILKSTPEIRNHRLIIGNAHINKLEFYVTDPFPRLKYVTGDNYPFLQRPVNNRLFIFPLTAANNSCYILRVDKHGESLQLTTDILSEDDFYQKSATETLINGLLWGVILLILIFGCFLYITVKESLYLHYVLYILSASLWIIADKGYGYQFLWPNLPEFASRARPVFSLLVTVAVLQFMQSFISQKRGTVLHKIIRLVKISSLMLLLAFLFVPYEYHNLAYSFLIVLSILSASPVVLIPLSLYPLIRIGNLQAWFYLISIFMLIVFAVTELLVHGGETGAQINYLSSYGIQTGLIIEVIILTFGLAHRFNSYKDEKEKLLLEINRKQGELTERIIETQELERKKISDQLHDDIGSMLSLATLQISSAIHQQENNSNAGTQLGKTVEVLASVASSIRHMSHTLTPLAIEKYGFKNAMIDLIKTINMAEQIQAEHIILGMENTDKYDLNFLNDLYRIIREILNNIIKHSAASHCLVQLIEYNDSISVMIEDNGRDVPFAEKNKKNGIGLNNIQSKIDYFNARIEVSLVKEGGTLVNIHLPLKTS